MTKHFRKELENIKKRILTLGSLVEDRLRLAIQAVDRVDLRGRPKRKRRQVGWTIEAVERQRRHGSGALGERRSADGGAVDPGAGFAGREAARRVRRRQGPTPSSTGAA